MTKTSAANYPVPQRLMRGASAREQGVAFLLLLAITVGQLAASGTWPLIFHPPWLDECLATTLANDPSFSHAMTALSHGGNHSPPVPFILLRPLRWMSGQVDVVELRAVGALAGIFAGVAVFAIARKFFDRISSFVAALSLWAHPVFIEQLYEARFYTLWLAATAWLFYFLLRCDQKPSRSSLIVASIAAALVTTLHWYGMLALGLIFATDFWIHRSLEHGARLRRATPFLVGMGALMCCLPMLQAQRRGLVVPTWIDPLSMKQIWLAAAQLYSLTPLSAAAIIYWICRKNEGQLSASRDLSSLLPISSLLLIPFLLLMLSAVGQPAMLSRYAIATTIPICLTVALLTSMIAGLRAKIIRIALLTFTAFWGCVELHDHAVLAGEGDQLIADAVSDTDKVISYNGPMPIVFLRRHEMYPLIYLRPDLSNSVALLNFDIPADDRLTTTQRFEQQMARIDRQDYPLYHLINYSELQRRKHFFVIVPPEAGIDLQKIFPDGQIRPHSRDLFEIMLP